jgi:phosphatidylglycerophosphatase C
MLKLRLITNHDFKERFCRVLLKGQSEKHIATVAGAFTRDYVERVLTAPIVEVLLHHARNGDEVYLVSSNFSFLLCHLQIMWPLSGVVATEAECFDGRYTGRVSGRSCDRGEKVARTIGLFGEEKVRTAIAYGDSLGDRELLTFVSRPNWVR